MTGQNRFPTVLMALGMIVALTGCAEEKSRSLDTYRLVAGPLAVAGVEDDLSGLAWNPVTGTLFASVNDPAIVVELSTEGEVLRSLKISEDNDTEGVALLPGNRLVVTEERLRNLLIFDIPAGKKDADLDRARAAKLKVVEAEPDNLGLEGVAYNLRENCIYVTKQKEPCLIYKVQLRGRSKNFKGAEVSEFLRVENLESLNGLHFDAVTGNLLVLSDDSKSVVEMTTDGKEISRLSGIDLSQPEGLAMDAEGALYIVSEPNIFAVYRQADKSASAAEQPAAPAGNR